MPFGLNLTENTLFEPTGENRCSVFAHTSSSEIISEHDKKTPNTKLDAGRNFTDYADNNLFASAFIMSFSALSTYTLSVTEPLLDFGT
mgnify:FL=1